MLVRAVFQGALVQELDVYSLDKYERAQISAGKRQTGIYKVNN